MEIKMFEMPPQNTINKPLKADLVEGNPYMAVAKVVPLFNANNEQKGFKIISLIKIDRKKKQEFEEQKPLLVSEKDKEVEL